MKYQPKYQVGERVLYNSLASAGASKGTIVSVDNNNEPHVYTVQSDLFKDWPEKNDTVKEGDIFGKI